MHDALCVSVSVNFPPPSFPFLSLAYTYIQCRMHTHLHSPTGTGTMMHATQACRNLHLTLRQVLLPVQAIISTVCADLSGAGEGARNASSGDGDGDGAVRGTYQYTNPYAASSSAPSSSSSSSSATVVRYLGIDASINPGLSLVDSVGAGIEHMLYCDLDGTSTSTSTSTSSGSGSGKGSGKGPDFSNLSGMHTTLADIDTRFGQFGTLPAVSAITRGACIYACALVCVCACSA